MVAQPASVSVARRFVDDALTGWGRQALVDDVGLCVSELSTNATLHSGSHYFEVELENVVGAVRVAVLDTGSGSADSITSRSEITDAFHDDLTADGAATTGRGMFIVSALADSWGIDELPSGKRVWAEFTPDDSGYETHAPRVTHREIPADVRFYDPDDWSVVRFLDCPAALLLAHDENLADTIRELRLVGVDADASPFRRIGELMAGHVQKHAVNWDAARLVALDAVRSGREYTDIDVLAPSDVSKDIRFLRALVNEAEALSEAGKLMVLPAAAGVQQVRDWLEAEFIAQAEHGHVPVPFREWVAARR